MLSWHLLEAEGNYTCNLDGYRKVTFIYRFYFASSPVFVVASITIASHRCVARHYSPGKGGNALSHTRDHGGTTLSVAKISYPFSENTCGTKHIYSGRNRSGVEVLFESNKFFSCDFFISHIIHLLLMIVSPNIITLQRKTFCYILLHDIHCFIPRDTNKENFRIHRESNIPLYFSHRNSLYRYCFRAVFSYASVNSSYFIMQLRFSFLEVQSIHKIFLDFQTSTTHKPC